MNASRAQEPSLSVDLHDPGRLPDDPLRELHVERLHAPAAAPDLAPERGMELDRRLPAAPAPDVSRSRSTTANATRSPRSPNAPTNPRQPPPPASCAPR